MNRRKFIATIGTAAAGASATVGTGAFTSVSADRSVSVQVADDADAFLAMTPSNGPNGEFAETTGDGTIALALTDTDAGGSGLGTDSVYEFDDVFRITNQGTQPVYAWATFAGASGDFTPNGTNTDIYLYPNGDSDDQLQDSDEDVLYLGVGQSAQIGVYVDTTDVTTDQDLTMTVNADVENPASGATVGGGGTTIPGPTNGLVSYWPLDSVGDGTAEDIVGTNDGALNGGVSAVSGEVDGAAAFDGSDDYVNVPDDPSLDLTGALTLAAWVKPSSDQDNYARILSREQSGAGNRQYNLGVDADATDPRTVVDTAGANGVEVSATVTFTDDSWHHAALTFDTSDAVRLYIDGTEEDSTPVNAPLVSRSSTVKFGAPAHLPGKDFFTGRIDDVRIYDRALSATEVSDLYGDTN
ncbi:LamG domain-containing protein [Halobellus ruber]|uniref:LamG domain-containing protein n=1 Tax=Halobellus ruber TaxID=2761102 RepID=A0A7J9SJS5_9EURY|nr:LamG domain-containing protein [Halobellus ruber]MBB6646633.1 LamG domain-containing protein [Halobellus ruber]